MAEVLGTLPVGGGGDAHPVDVDLEGLRDDLGHLGVEPLAHLGAAVVQVNGAVAVDMHQGAGLVVGGLSVKEMPNFTGVSAIPHLITGEVSFERPDGIPPAVIAAVGLPASR